MNATRMHSRLPLTVLTTLIVMLAGVTAAHAAETYTGPVKEIFSSQIGWEVDKTKDNFCLAASGECQEARPSSEPGGFRSTNGVAVNNDKTSPQYGDLYVIDTTHRVQVLKPDGTFVSMFGWDVNKTKVKTGVATQQELNVCTATEIKAGSECQPGVEGGAPGQFGESQSSIAVDPTTGAIYVTDLVKANLGGKTTNGERVQKFTAADEWVWETGKEVNKTKDGTPGASPQEKDICTQKEVEKGVECTEPAQYAFGAEPPANSTEPGVFPIGSPTVLAVGGAEDVLYAGAGRRIQEFAADGSYMDQIQLAGTVVEMALDDSCELHEPTVLTEATTPTCASFDPFYGYLYVVYSEDQTVVHKLAADGGAAGEFPSAKASNPEKVFVNALAVDTVGRLAISGNEEVNHALAQFGSLLNGAAGRLMTEFEVPLTVHNLAFDTSDEMYGSRGFEVVSYTPVHVAELLTRPASCATGAESETDATFDCTLNGEVNPEEVPETEVWFQWGLTSALGEVAPKLPIAIPTGNTLVPVPPPPAPSGVEIEGVRPNQTVYYRLAAHDQNLKAPELVTSDMASPETPMVPPRIVGSPSAPFVRSSSSAVLYGELNPENASTKYFFEYGAELGGYCEGALKTKALVSTVYGKIGATLEATGLQPATTYKYRLCAADKAGKATGKIEEGSFMTLAAPVPQVTTGAYSALGTTSATISGTVNPDGRPATYAFELGVYEEASTQYGVVFAGPAGAGIVPIEKTLVLTGLQPGTTYAYRIKIESGYGKAKGETATFTTAGLPSVLVVPNPLAMLVVPNIAFPVEPKAPKPPKCKRGYKRDKRGKCVKPKKRTNSRGKGAHGKKK